MSFLNEDADTQARGDVTTPLVKQTRKNKGKEIIRRRCKRKLHRAILPFWYDAIFYHRHFVHPPRQIMTCVIQTNSLLLVGILFMLYPFLSFGFIQRPKRDYFDVIFVALNILLILHWHFFRGECVLIFLERRALDPKYTMGRCDSSAWQILTPSKKHGNLSYTWKIIQPSSSTSDIVEFYIRTAWCVIVSVGVLCVIMRCDSLSGKHKAAVILIIFGLIGWLFWKTIRKKPLDAETAKYCCRLRERYQPGAIHKPHPFLPLHWQGVSSHFDGHRTQ